MPSAPDLAGSALDGRYELHALIGEGAFGRVYRGVDRRLEREVAVKVIKPWWAQDSLWVARFEREARLLARVSDPGIVQIFDIGHAEQGPYYVAELVHGESLAERLRADAMAPAEAVAIAERLCDALASAHARGIVHCDVKPANVLLAPDGRVKVGDFGVARLAGSATSQALTTTVAGTPRYMAPEQARGRRTNPATDVYSTGVVLYEMLAGEPPFAHGSAVELGLRHVQDEPPPLPERVPVPLREIVARALAKRPAERFADAAQMAAALRSIDHAELSSRALARRSEKSAGAGVDAGDRAHDGAGETAQTEHQAAEALARTRLIPRASASARPSASAAATPSDGALAFTEPRAPRDRHLHRGAKRRRGPIVLAAGVALAVAAVVVLLIRSGAGAVPAKVPSVVGQSSASAEREISRAGFRFAEKRVPALGSTPGDVTRQSPLPGVGAKHGATVALSVAEQPRWRTLTTFAGVDDGHSVPFRIDGRRWRVRYAMSYEGSCTLLVLCFGPGAEASNLRTGDAFDGFDLSAGASHGHTFESGPGLYQMNVSGGDDSARWSMTVQDYY